VRGLASNIGIRLAIVALVAGGAFVFRDRLSGHAGDLQVGDCFDVPSSAVQEVGDVQHHPCNEAHTGEVVYVGDYPDATAYPSDDQWRAHVTTHCVPAFNTYTGLDFANDVVFDMGFFTPTAEGWGDGDREVTCYAARIDGASLASSIKK
jgi:hypothetical protein